MLRSRFATSSGLPTIHRLSIKYSGVTSVSAISGCCLNRPCPNSLNQYCWKSRVSVFSAASFRGLCGGVLQRIPHAQIRHIEPVWCPPRPLSTPPLPLPNCVLITDMGTRLILIEIQPRSPANTNVSDLGDEPAIRNRRMRLLIRLDVNPEPYFISRLRNSKVPILTFIQSGFGVLPQFEHRIHPFSGRLSPVNLFRIKPKHLVIAGALNLNRPPQ